MNSTTVSLSTVLKEELKNPEVALSFQKHRHEIELVMQIIAARKARHWTQHDLAQRAGIRQQALSRIECQKTFPNLKSLVKLADVLELELVFVPRQSTISESTP